MGDAFEEITAAEAKSLKMTMDGKIDRKGHGWWDSSYRHIWAIKDVIYAMLRDKPVSESCEYCGKELQFEIEGNTLNILNEPCQNPDGVGDQYSAELSIPSGRIVFANDLRDLVCDRRSEQPDFDVNSLLGERKCFDWYAERGCGHGFVGNSSPRVFQDDSTFRLVYPDFDSEDPETIDEFGTKLMTIDTGLWWYSIMDYELAIERGLYESSKFHQVAKTEPGTYTLTHYPRFNDERPFVFADLRLKGT